MKPKLLPCPFCGSEAASDNGFSPCESVTYAWCKNQECHLHLIGDAGLSQEEWNTRAPAQPAQVQGWQMVMPDDNADQRALLALVIESHEEKHGSLRSAAKALGLDPAYLSRLKSGEKTNPSAEVLAAFGLERYFYYRPLLAAAPKSPVQEPVAWMVSGGESRPKTYEQYPEWAVGDSVLVISPLYTAPQPKPDVQALVEALEMIESAHAGISKDELQETAYAALAAYKGQTK